MDKKENEMANLEAKVRWCVCLLVCTNAHDMFALMKVTGVLFLLVSSLIAWCWNSIQLTKCGTGDRYHLSKTLTLRAC